jgi:hypothetical protein
MANLCHGAALNGNGWRGDAGAVKAGLPWRGRDLTMRLFPLLGLLALLSAAPASADWTYARWGMSAAQVVAASSGQAQLAKQDSKTNTVFGSTGAEATYSQSPFTFRVIFNFRYDKLTQVTLHPQPKADCSPLVNELTRQFGPPEVKSLYTGITSFFWSNTATANDIRLLRVPATCSILYIQHGVVPARAPQGRARFDSLNPGPRQDIEKPARGKKD